MKRVLVAGVALSLLAACETTSAAVSPRKHVVFFDWDRAAITAQAAATVRTAADQAKAGGTVRVDIVGHTDTSGDTGYNMALSIRRANAVKDELIRNGVNPQSIALAGKGESQPLVATGDGVREPQNRRAEITIVP